MEDVTQAVAIPLSQGKVAFVDAEDAHLAQWSWYAHKSGAGVWYARRAVKTTAVPSGWTTVRLHTDIMQPPRGHEVDHRDGDGLNNRRSNLRVATHRQNMANYPLPVTNTSGFKGVWWNKKAEKWKGQIQVDGKKIHLGLFSDPTVAARAYDEAATEHFGEFAHLNFGRVGS